MTFGIHPFGSHSMLVLQGYIQYACDNRVDEIEIVGILHAGRWRGVPFA